MKALWFLLFLVIPFLGQSEQKAYVINRGSSTQVLTVIETSSDTIADIIDLSFPVFTRGDVAISPDNTKIYAADSSSEPGVDVVNAFSGAVFTQIPTLGNSSSVVILPNGTKGYIRSDDAIQVFDTSTDTIIKIISDTPSSLNYLAVTPDGSKVYFTNATTDSIGVIDTSTDTIIDTISPIGTPERLAVTPDGTKLYVTNLASLNLIVIDTATDTITTTIALTIPPASIAITPDGSTAYVGGLAGSSTLDLIDIATDTVTTTISAGGANTQDIAITPDGTKAYVANRSDSNFAIIDIATNTVIKNVPIFVAGAVAITHPSSQVTSERKANISLGQTEFSNIVTWTTPTDITTRSYLIYRDAALTDLAAEINDPSILQYEEHNTSDEAFTYAVVAVDEFNNRYLIGKAFLNFE